MSSLWAEYARAKGFTFVPPAGDWPNRTVPRLMAVSGDLRIVLVREGEQVVTRMELRQCSPPTWRAHCQRQLPGSDSA